VRFPLTPSGLFSAFPWPCFDNCKQTPTSLRLVSLQAAADLIDGAGGGILVSKAAWPRAASSAHLLPLPLSGVRPRYHSAFQ
jgi:hypothetical protein